MSRPLRFLHLSTFYPPDCFGGDGIYLQRLARALVEQGHRVDVVHCVDSYQMLQTVQPGIEQYKHPNLTVHSLHSRYGFVSPLLSHQTGRPYLKERAIGEIIRSTQPDVIHFHNISLLGPEVLALGRGVEAVKLYTAHEYWLICPTHVLWKFNREPCEKTDCIRCTLMAKRPPQLWRHTGMLARCAREVDAFLAPSRFSAEIHRARGFELTMQHFPLFVERADADWQNPAPRPHERPYFLFVGRLETIKGIRPLIEAWNKGAQTDLLIAGSGTEEAELRILAGANPRISFLGHVQPGALGNLYVNSIACIVPSLCYEVFPNVILESFARKTPIIAHDHGAMSEMVRESGGGLLYTNEAELLSAVTQLSKSATLRAELAEKAYRAFDTRWSPEAHLNRYFELLRNLAERKFGRIPWQVAEENSSPAEINDSQSSASRVATISRS
jgi:glycosyltransferase involved in cell wall biosynthesis